MTPLLKKLSFLIIATFLVLPLRASLRSRTITMTDGLRSNTVRSLAQDVDGFIWMGTDNGLCRYDGVSVRPFLIRGAKDQYVTDVLSFGNGLVVGTGRGIYWLDLCTEQFEHVETKSQDGQAISSQVTSVRADRDSNLWVSTIGQGVFCYSHHDRRLTHIPVSQPRQVNSKIYIDNEDQVWLVSNSLTSPLARFDKSRNRFVPVRLRTSLPEHASLSMLQLRDGSRWLGTWNRGLCRITDTGELVPVASGTPLTHIHTLYELSADRLLVGCEEGLLVFNPQTGAVTGFFNAPSTGWGVTISDAVSSFMTPHFVYSVMQDREGGVWYSTFYTGVNYVPPVGERFRAFTPANTQGMVGNVISRFCEDPQGHIWIASDDGGVSCYAPRIGHFVNLPAQQQLGTVNAHAFCMDGDNLWIGTYSNGVYIINTKTYALTHVDNFPQSVYAFCRDRAGRIWIGTMEGLYLYTASTRQFTRVRALPAVIIDIDEDARGNLWISTQGDGLWRYTPLSRRWKHYVPDSTETSLPDLQVNNVCIDMNGRVVVATPQGVCIYQPRTDRFSQLRFDAMSQSVSSVIDVQGVLWMSTERGIIRYSGSEGIQMFNRYDGLQSEQFLPNAGLMTSDGCIYFGSTQGFCSFYPYLIKVNRQAPQVYITRLEIFNHTIETGSDILPRALTHTDRIELDHDDDIFSLYFAAMSYCSPEKNQYAYRLEGFDKEWNYVGSSAKATYTNLPAGTYTFRVKATNNDGVWSHHEATLTIVVHPPFWWSLPAKVIYVLLIGVGIWLYSQMRLRKAEVRHRQEMRRLNDRKDVEVREARLRFFTMIAHEIRTPVSLIIGPLETLMKDIVNNPRADLMGHRESLQMIERNAHRLLELVNQLLDFNKMQAEPQCQFTECNMGEIVASVAERFQPTLKQKNADFQVVYPPADYRAVVDREGITKVISNLMTNATKYTRSEVKLSCRVADDRSYFILEVSDNGMGISKADQQKIFNPFFQAHDNKPGTGIGLAIVDNLVKMHGGQVSVESEVGKGATFRVVIPTRQLDLPAALSAEKPAEHQLAADVQPAAAVQTAVVDPTEEAVGEGALLIVEDDDDMLRFLVSNFKPDYTVITARNGREGLEQLARNHVSMIISDWMMPEMDGAEYCRRVRADRRYSHIPFVMLTAKTDDESKTEGMTCGADTYIEKPFSVQYLRACIKNMLDIRRMLFHKYSASPNVPISEVTTSEVDNELFSQMTQIIEDNIDNEALNVNFLAEKLSISRSGLFAKVKAIADVTPNELIQIVRLRHAARLLAEKKYRINEVSYMVGFSSPSYFSKCFQKQFGVTPGQYGHGAQSPSR